MQSKMLRTPVFPIAWWIKGLILLIGLGVAMRSGLAEVARSEPEPSLRIEAGGHTAPITAISADAANRYVVSASEDKTLRIWSLREGRPIAVLRVPIGTGNQGKLYAAAFSPDGRTIAAGGWTDLVHRMVS